MHNGVPVRYGKPTRRKDPKFSIIMIVVIIIVAILAIIYFLNGIFFNVNDNKLPKQNNNEIMESTQINEPKPEQIVEGNPDENPQEVDVTPAEGETEDTEDTESEIVADDTTLADEKADDDKNTDSAEKIQPENAEIIPEETENTTGEENATEADVDESAETQSDNDDLAEGGI